ncbi:hypothetical protein AVEN_109591-1, partial [Araneus ventricosus]
PRRQQDTFLGRRVVLSAAVKDLAQANGLLYLGLGPVLNIAPMPYPLASERIFVSAFGRKCPKQTTGQQLQELRKTPLRCSP